MREDTLCEIIQDGKILLKLALRGISKGKWNGLGGRIEENETDMECAVREVFEESGLKVRDLIKHGTNIFFKGNEPLVKVHIFSAKEFEGRLKQSEEGELRWFGLKELPYDKMWPDDIHWLPLLLEGKKFDAEFHFDEDMKEIIKHRIEVRF